MGTPLRTGAIWRRSNAVASPRIGASLVTGVLGKLCTGHDTDELRVLEHARGRWESGSAPLGGAHPASRARLPTASVSTGDTSPPPGASGIAPYRDWRARRA